MLNDTYIQQENHLLAEINTTPLVDVMLVLLVVFMVTMPLITSSIPIELPRSAAVAAHTEPPSQVTITITEDALFYLDTKQITLVELTEVFNHLSDNNRETVIAIAADQQVAYRHVVQLLDLAKKAGLTKIGFVTQQNS